ncbi:glycosyltransferase family 8 protein [Candidatus Saccharibacteria bacterium]|nr:glycosyltransferase family 8 protein [Candidatus Saccharibacteria bacterium]
MSIFNTGLSPIKRARAVPIFYAINSAYAPYVAASMNSLTKHLDPKRYYRVIILHDGLNLANRLRLRNLVTKNCAIQFRKINRNLYLKALIKYCSKRKGAGDFFSAAVYYYRFFIPRLFPIYDKCVYIDSDTILTGDIGELYDTELGDDAVAAVVDPKVDVIREFRDYVNNAVGVPYKEYVNDGVMVMNLKKLRKMHYLSVLIGMIEKYDADLVAPDQDYLNVILRGKIKHLDKVWNTEPTEKLSEGTKLVHFNLFNKPWHYKNVPSEEIFWDAAKGTGFYGDLRRQQRAFGKTKQKAEHDKVEALIKKGAKLAKAKEPIIKV